MSELIIKTVAEIESKETKEEVFAKDLPPGTIYKDRAGCLSIVAEEEKELLLTHSSSNDAYFWFSVGRIGAERVVKVLGKLRGIIIEP